MGLSSYTRTPGFKIEIVRPDYEHAQSYREDNVVTFGVNTSEGASTACVSYRFSEALSSPEGAFSLSLTPERDSQGRTWYDKIRKRDLVRIEEHGLVRFVGYVTNRRYAARMGDKGPERNIIITGNSIGALLVYFTILLDIHILSSTATGETAQIQYMETIAANIDKNQSFAGIIQSIKTAYFQAMEATGGNQNLGVRHIIDTFFDFSTKMSSSVVAQYPIVVSAFQTGENNLWETIQQLLNPPFHELFGMWNPTSKKYELWFRQTPFDATDWASLPITRIPDDLPALLFQDYDIGDSDEDVKTWFICTLPGSAISREKATTLDSYSRSSVKDESKWPYYGYRPMYAECRFFNRSEDNQQEFSGAEQLMHDLSQKLKDWYSNNADFLTGTITCMNVQNSDYSSYPRIGERLGFLDGEFYIEGTESSWQYGGPMLRTLQISRGYMYTSGGAQREPIPQVGPKIGILEQEEVSHG
jgi:hypothetical protein